MISLLGSSKMVLLAIENDYCLEYFEVLFVLYLSWFSSVSLGFLYKIHSGLEWYFPTLGHLKDIIKMVQLKGFLVFFFKHWILNKWLVSKYCECQFPLFFSLSLVHWEQIQHLSFEQLLLGALPVPCILSTKIILVYHQGVGEYLKVCFLFLFWKDYLSVSFFPVCKLITDAFYKERAFINCPAYMSWDFSLIKTCIFAWS